MDKIDLTKQKKIINTALFNAIPPNDRSVILKQVEKNVLALYKNKRISSYLKYFIVELLKNMDEDRVNRINSFESALKELFDSVNQGKNPTTCLNNIIVELDSIDLDDINNSLTILKEDNELKPKLVTALKNSFSLINSFIKLYDDPAIILGEDAVEEYLEYTRYILYIILFKICRSIEDYNRFFNTEEPEVWHKINMCGMSLEFREILYSEENSKIFELFSRTGRFSIINLQQSLDKTLSVKN